MRAAVALGTRLAAGTAGQRARTFALVAASAVGVAVVLLVWGIAASQIGSTEAFKSRQVTLLMAGTIGMVALPALVLVVTVARLSAAVRDRRLANLRLVGMTASQTRAVAATEVGIASVVGAVSGALLFGVAVPVVVRFGLVGQDWTASTLFPPLVGWASVLVVVPAATVLTAVAPHGLTAANALERSRRAEGRPPSWWRLAPATVGLLLCWWSRSPLDDSSSLSGTEVVAIFLGIALLGVGVVTLVPVFVALVAQLVLAFGRGALATLVGRRLQSQPVTATRVIAALMIGLFVLVGARSVIVAFETTPQYVNAARVVEREQTAEVTTTAQDLQPTVDTLAGIGGVRNVAAFPTLLGEQRATPEGATQMPVVVASCDDLARSGTQMLGCSQTRPTVVGDAATLTSDDQRLAVRYTYEGNPEGRAVFLDLNRVNTMSFEEFSQASGIFSGVPLVIVPPDAPGIASMSQRTDHTTVAYAGPGRDLYNEVQALDLRVNSTVDFANYDFVAGLRTMIWTLAVVVIAVGLLTFTIAGIDRALARRRELTGLRLLGTPAATLRWGQWLEAALPTILGSLLAILAGGYAGATYLQLDDTTSLPTREVLALAAAAGVTSALLALVTVIGTNIRLNPQHVRSE